MESKTFNPHDYFTLLAQTNRLCRSENFQVAFCSGPENLEGVMAEFRDKENFVVIDDTTDNNVHGQRPGWFTKSVYTVWILAATDFDDTEMHKERMALCRTVFRQMLSRMVRDKQLLVYGDKMFYLGLDRIYYKELGRYSLNGCTGLYFMVENDVPTDLTYNADEWN